MPLIAALTAILMWSSLATLTVSLEGVPPLYLTGMSLFIGGALSLPWAMRWSLDRRSLAVGIYGQFTYHVLYIVALRSAPPVNANLVHYAWPLLILLMAPLTGQGLKLGWVHILAAAAAFSGVVLATSDGVELSLRWHPGYAFALAAAFVWATYSIAEARSKSSSPVDVGPACMVSGLLALAGHVAFEPPASLDASQWMLMIALGVGPTGGAFYLWSLAMRRVDARIIGVLSNATPILSTLMLVVLGSRSMSLATVGATLLVAASSVVVFLASRQSRRPMIREGGSPSAVPERAACPKRIPDSAHIGIGPRAS
ncbi:MAG: DMT family transporter [Variovorax sp.]|nr:MAG: DMT family transporter [Variovorax sp.]